MSFPTGERLVGYRVARRRSGGHSGFCEEVHAEDEEWPGPASKQSPWEAKICANVHLRGWEVLMLPSNLQREARPPNGRAHGCIVCILLWGMVRRT